MSIYSSETDIFSQKIQNSPINIPKSYLLFRTSFNTATFRGTDFNNTDFVPSLSVDFSSPNVFEKSSELKSANIYSSSVDFTDRRSVTSTDDRGFYVTKGAVKPTDKHLYPINNIPMSNNWQFSEITQLSIYTPIKTPLRINKKHRSISQKKVNFEPKYDKIIIIQGLSFYNENNMKKDIWWSTTELNNMRQMATNEINRMKQLHPRWSVTQCIQELYRLDN